MATTLAQFTAADSSASPNHTFSLFDQNNTTHNHLFTMESNGTLKNAVVFDYESNSSHLIRVRVVDDQNRSFSKEFTITIGNVNENPIIYSNGGGATASLSIAENQTVVSTVQASDPDNGSIFYSISGGADQLDFSINGATGALSFNPAPDFENPTDSDTNNIYEVVVTATDDGNLTDSQTLTVSVTDVYEYVNSPPTDINATGTLSVLENQPVGTLISGFTATDADTNATHVFSLYDQNGTTHNNLFTMDGNGSLRTGAILDYESNTTHPIQVRVTDDQGATFDKTFIVQVLNLNESPIIAQGTVHYLPPF